MSSTRFTASLFRISEELTPVSLKGPHSPRTSKLLSLSLGGLWRYFIAGTTDEILSQFHPPELLPVSPPWRRRAGPKFLALSIPPQQFLAPTLKLPAPILPANSPPAHQHARDALTQATLEMASEMEMREGMTEQPCSEPGSQRSYDGNQFSWKPVQVPWKGY